MNRGYKVDPRTEHLFRKGKLGGCVDCGQIYDGVGHVLARRRAAGKTEAEIYHMTGQSPLDKS